MNPTQVYDHEVRILTCHHCGAPLQVPRGGGFAKCQYCQATATYQARTERAEIQALQTRAPVNEYERFQKLREQQGKLLLPPAGLEYLVVGGSIPGGLVQQAQAEWQRAVAEVRQGGHFGIHERLHFLTMALCNRGGGDVYWQRACMETALETLQAPQHKSQLRCMLARSAAKLGDIASAEAWLEACDPASWHLEVDSEYRFAQAYIATRKQDYSTVLRWLGAVPDEVPIHDSSRLIAGVFRANALERMGRLQEAMTQISTLVRPGDPPDFVERALAAHEQLQLCPYSRQAAVRQTPAAQTARGAGGILSALIGGVVTIPFVLLSAGFVVAGFFVDPAATTDDGYPLNYFFWFMGAMFTATSLPAPALIWWIRRKSQVAATWEKAQASVLSIESTGWTVNDQPQFRLTVRVFRGDNPPYEASFKTCLPPHQVGSVVPGASLTVSVDPSNPKNVRP
jgi:LSD1 subclass zinc finger protein